MLSEGRMHLRRLACHLTALLMAVEGQHQWHPSRSRNGGVGPPPQQFPKGHHGRPMSSSLAE